MPTSIINDALDAITLMIQRNQIPMSTTEIMHFQTWYKSWEIGASYEPKEILKYSGKIYQTLQKVTNAQAEHTPDKASSLYKQILEPDASGVFPWVQPLGATDAYAKGAKVTHAGKTWTSDVDANVWEPGVYGWTEVTA